MLPSERVMQAEFAVSRPVIREAIKTLAAKGLVSITGQGALITADYTTPALESLTLLLRHAQVNTDDILETRLLIEPLVASLAAAQAGPLQIRHLVAANQKLIALHATYSDEVDVQSAELWFTHDAQFHALLAQSTQNPVLAVLVQLIVGVLWRERWSTYVNLPPRHRTAVIEGHRQVIEAVERKMPENAAQAMRDHITYTRSFVAEKVK
jgi:DNA-binding FadR family transcriptional regulator